MDKIISTCKIIKEDPSLKSIPVILFSSYSDNKDTRAKLFRSGCDDILVKPYKKQELLYVIKKHTTVSTREHKRKPVEIDVDCNILMETGLYNSAEIVSGKVIDMSIGGMLVEIKDPFPVDTYLEFNVFIDGQSNGIPARGRVAWSNKQKMGIQFLYTPLQIEVLVAERA